MSDQQSQALEAASTVLVTAPDGDGEGVDSLADLLLETGKRADRILLVTVGSTPGEWHTTLTRRSDGPLPPVSYVDVKTLVRSRSDDQTEDVPAPVATISSPADLVSLGTSINSLVNDAESDGDRVVLCIHSITEMLQFVDREFLFKFLHALSARVRNANGVGLYHLDSETPDEKLRIMFAHLCDTVVSFEDEGMEVSSGYYSPASEEPEI